MGYPSFTKFSSFFLNSLRHSSFHLCLHQAPSYSELCQWARRSMLCHASRGPSLSNLPTWEPGHLKSHKGPPLPVTSTISLKSDIFIVSGESSCSRTSLPWGRHCLSQLCQVLWGSWRLTLKHWIWLHISQGANVMSNKLRWHLLGNRHCPNGRLLHTKSFFMQQSMLISRRNSYRYLGAQTWCAAPISG